MRIDVYVGSRERETNMRRRVTNLNANASAERLFFTILQREEVRRGNIGQQVSLFCWLADNFEGNRNEMDCRS